MGNTPEKCSQCNYVYSNVMMEEDPTYTAECTRGYKLGTCINPEIDNRTCKTESVGITTVVVHLSIKDYGIPPKSVAHELLTDLLKGKPASGVLLGQITNFNVEGYEDEFENLDNPNYPISYLDDEDTEVTCGLCERTAKLTKLKVPQPISQYDREHDHRRYQSFNCCGRSWLLNPEDDTPVDCGPEVY